MALNEALSRLGLVTALRRGLRRLRRFVALALALLLITAAVAVALSAQLMPLLERHPQRVAAWLSERIGQPVEISALSARWSRRGPLLDLEGLRIGGGPAGGGVDIGQARLRINVYAGLLPGQPLLSLRVEGLRLELARDVEGRWRVRGFYGGTGVDIEQALAQLERIGELELFGGKLVIEDRFADIDLVLERIDARLRTLGGRFRFALRVHGADDSPLRLVADFDTRLLDGRARLWGRGLDLPGWLQGSTFEGLGLATGRAELEAWLTVEQGLMREVWVDLEADALAAEAAVGSLHSALLPGPVRLRAGWQQQPGGWGLDLHELRFGDPRAGAPTRARVQQADGLLKVAVDTLDLAPLSALAGWWPALSAAQRDWLKAAAPEGHVHDIELLLREGGLERLQLRAEGLGFAAVEAVPGVSGLDLRVVGDRQGSWIEINSPGFSLQAPASLSAPIEAELVAGLAMWPEAGEWRIDVASLRVRGEDFGAHVHGGVRLGGERRRPRLDLHARVDDSPVQAAHRFWVRNKMPPPTVEWLERALVEGRVLDGEAVIGGELDDWPFDAPGSGRFHARARVQDVVLDYLPGWPHGERLAGSVDFVNDSMSAEVAADVRGVAVRSARGRIADFSEPVLELELAGGGQGAQLLRLLRATPLWARFGDAMRGLSVGGRGEVEVGIRAPLKRELGELALDGHVDLGDADLVDTQWNLRFGAASGRLRFNQRGFSADELGVRFDGQPGSLSLAAGDATAHEDNAFEATLRGAFSTDSLLAPRPELHWLEPYLLGRSQWSIELSVPEPRLGLRSRLRVGSTLEGVAVRLPAPLRKPASSPLPLQLEVAIPATEPAPGGSVELRLGQLLHLRAQPGENPAEFRGRAVFGGAAGAALPERGIEVQGRVPVLDAVGWLGLGFAGDGEGIVLGGIQLEAGAMAVGERLLPDFALDLSADSGQGRRLQLRSPDVQGEVDWPAGFERPLRARFSHLRWPGEPAQDERVGTQPASRRPVIEPDPTLLPALDIEIEDLGFGSARLGALSLKTRRGADGQLVDVLSTRSADLKVDIRGDWSRTLQGSESRFSIGFEGDDLGRMLAAFGLPALVEGGATRADMDLRWRGGPANFAFAAADGQLRLSVGRGRLPELDPGAGRLLGLLSLAEIPRRLSLDFSDFFRSGFGFNGIEGSFALAGGSAVTEDLRIDAPAAEIRMRGRTGLAARDYDLQVEVLPRTGSVLPALGAITGGPAGAAVGAVAQAVLQQPMKQVNRTLYHLDGGWDEPRIEIVERGPSRPEQPPRPPLRATESGRSSPAPG